MIPLLTLGDHRGYVRQIARGVRLNSRPYVERWQNEYLEPADALLRAQVLFERPPSVDAITWVPGHDGSPGPGFDLAIALASRWKIPLIECLVRVLPIRSAHSAIRRPSEAESRSSMAVAGPPRDGVMVVDNVIASGASMAAALSVLEDGGWRGLAALAISVDTNAGSSRYLETWGPRVAWATGASGSRILMPKCLAPTGRAPVNFVLSHGLNRLAIA